jgi:starch phosphorylase
MATERTLSPEGSQLSPRYAAFLKECGIPPERNVFTPKTPLCLVTMGHYGDGFMGTGGLEVLTGDIVNEAVFLDIPMVLVTPGYTIDPYQRMENFRQVFDGRPVPPEARGGKWIGRTAVRTTDSCPFTDIDLYLKNRGSVQILYPSEPNLKEIYHNSNSCDHRLYQQVVCGFGGYYGLKEIGVTPPFYHLNEAPTVFMDIARLDELTFKTQYFAHALDFVKRTTLYTNHTIVQAVESMFTFDQFRHYVFPNIRTAVTQNWLYQVFEVSNRGIKREEEWELKLSTLISELAGKANGVSKLHAQEASKQYRDAFGNFLCFESVTNGIFIEKWFPTNLYKLFHTAGILDEFDLPTKDYKAKVDGLDGRILKDIHKEGSRNLKNYLRTDRIDQYGNHVDIPEDALIAYWARRMAEYKRPDLMFDDPDKLAAILEEQNIHLILAGKAHPNDIGMQDKLEEILRTVDANPILKKRVHYIQDYDIPLGEALAKGGDIYINTPTVIDEITKKRKSTEASGTSGEKAPLAKQVSINDGHYRDDEDESLFEIKGNNREEELTSLYENIVKAALACRDEAEDIRISKLQIKNNLPKYSGTRMMKKYFKLYLS